MVTGPTSPDSMDRAIGQMIMAGFRGISIDPEQPLSRQLRGIPPGFMALFDEDVAGGAPEYNIRNPAQLRHLVAEVQALSPETILFALDQEGGRVARLKPSQGFPASESARSLGSKNDPAATRRTAAESARALFESGIHLNLAPVVDLDLNPENRIIGGKERSYSASPDIVIVHAAEFIRAHHENGVLCTLKHFPGQGSAPGDTHVGFVDATDQWNESELEPFRRLLSMGLADAVMTAHIVNRNLDPAWPATLSDAIIQGVLRTRLGFEGVVITDDLQMKAISDRYGLETIVVRAIQAGADVLTFANNVVDADPEIIARVVATVRQMVRQGVLSADRIEQSVRRIRELKARAAQLSAHRVRATGITIPSPVPPKIERDELSEYREQFAQIQKRVEDLVSPLDDRGLTWIPGPDRWSVGECIEHLSVIASLLIPRIEEAIRRGRDGGLFGSGPFEYSWPGRMFVESLQPSVRIRIRTMKLYHPRQGVPKDEILSRFARFQGEFLRNVDAARGLDLARIKVASPANRLLRFSLGIWLAASVAHEQRHIEQALRVMKEKGFPPR